MGRLVRAEGREGRPSLAAVAQRARGGKEGSAVRVGWKEPGVPPTGLALRGGPGWEFPSATRDVWSSWGRLVGRADAATEVLAFEDAIVVVADAADHVVVRPCVAVDAGGAGIRDLADLARLSGDEWLGDRPHPAHVDLASDPAHLALLRRVGDVALAFAELGMDEVHVERQRRPGGRPHLGSSFPGGGHGPLVRALLVTASRAAGPVEGWAPGRHGHPGLASSWLPSPTFARFECTATGAASRTVSTALAGPARLRVLAWLGELGRADRARRARTAWGMPPARRAVAGRAA